MPLGYAGAVLITHGGGGAFGRRPRERGIFLGFFLAGLAYGASTPILLDATSRLPGFSLALNYRLVFLAPLGLAALAALGADRLIQRRSTTGELAIAAVGSLALLSIVFFLSRGVFRERGPADFVARSFAAETAPLLLLASRRWSEGRGRAASSGRRDPARRAARAEWAASTRRCPRCLVARDSDAGVAAPGGEPGAWSRPGIPCAPTAPLSRARGRARIRVPRAAPLRGEVSAMVPRQFASHNRVTTSRAVPAFLNARYAVGGRGIAPRGWTLPREAARIDVREPDGAAARLRLGGRAGRADARRRLAQMSHASDFRGPPGWMGHGSRLAKRRGPVRVREIVPDLVTRRTSESARSSRRRSRTGRAGTRGPARSRFRLQT